jgi:hypothetical protein
MEASPAPRILVLAMLTAGVAVPQAWAGSPLQPPTKLTRAAASKPGAEVPKPAKPVAAAEKPASSRGDPRFDEARRRYLQALGVVVPEGKPDPKQPAGFERDPDKSVLVLDAAGVGMLLQRHWRGAGIAADAARQQIRRNRGFIGLARMLKLDPGIGAAQASFGTPAENGVAELADALDAARFELAGSPKTPRLAAAVREQERELEAAVARLPRGPGKSWALADLDLNDDRKVDRKDIELAKAALDHQPAQTVRSAALGGIPGPRPTSAIAKEP